MGVGFVLPRTAPGRQDRHPAALLLHSLVLESNLSLGSRSLPSLPLSPLLLPPLPPFRLSQVNKESNLKQPVSRL